MSEQTARPTVEAVAQAIESYIKRATIPAGNIFREPVGVTPTQVARAVLALLPGRPERELLAQGWDEGYTRGVADYRLGKWLPTDTGAEAYPDRRPLAPNPYRADRIEADR